MEALLTPSANYLTLDPVCDPEKWSLLRSRDNLMSHGFINYESKFLMGENSGQCLDVINEIEQKNNSTLQCPHQVRQGENFDVKKHY